ncbi:MAG: hypothetical protein ACFUZC_04410 [Chthoniobacteraceae bacterium]
MKVVKQGRGTNSLIKAWRLVGIMALTVASATAIAEPAASPNASETSVGSTITSFAELNTAAIKTDVAFIYLPPKGGSGPSPLTAMKSAVRTLESKGTKCELFTLKPGSHDYDQITAKKLTLPAVLVMVKGRSTNTVSGDITETKLVQGYVAASRTGSCGAGGCGSGCR